MDVIGDWALGALESEQQVLHCIAAGDQFLMGEPCVFYVGGDHGIGLGHYASLMPAEMPGCYHDHWVGSSESCDRISVPTNAEDECDFWDRFGLWRRGFSAWIVS